MTPYILGTVAVICLLTLCSMSVKSIFKLWSSDQEVTRETPMDSQMPRTPQMQQAQPSHFIAPFKSPTPGPSFGHFLTKNKARGTNPFTKETRTGCPSTPGYQTLIVKENTTTSITPDYSELARLAPTHYETLQRMGLLDAQGTPTKKMLEREQERVRDRDARDGRGVIGESGKE